MKTIRSFLAINLDLKVVHSIAEKQIKIKNAAEKLETKINWVPPQNMHVTIRFLGHITEPMVQALKDNIKPVTRSFAPFEIQASNLGIFSNGDNPKVVWVGIDDNEKVLASLHAKISKVIEEAGFKGDNQPFKSHITIGRIKGTSPAESNEIADELLKQFQPISFGVSKINDLVCYQSDLKRIGADYRKIWRLPLWNRYRTAARPIASAPVLTHTSENQEIVHKEQNENES